MTVAARSVNQDIFSQLEVLNLKALQELKEETSVEVLAFPPEALQEFKRLTAETLDEEAAKNASFKKVYEAYKKFQAENAAWNAISDDAYGRALQP